MTYASSSGYSSSYSATAARTRFSIRSSSMWTSSSVGGSRRWKRSAESSPVWKTPSGSQEWACGVSCKTLPQNWSMVTAPGMGSLMPSRRARRLW